MPPQNRSTARQIRKLSKIFKALARSFDGLAPMLQAAAAPGRNGSSLATTKTGRKRPTLSPAHRKALKLQGAYMGTMRRLKPRQAAKVKEIRAAKGIRAAIAAARRMAN